MTCGWRGRGIDGTVGTSARTALLERGVKGGGAWEADAQNAHGNCSPRRGCTWCRASLWRPRRRCASWSTSRGPYELVEVRNDPSRRCQSLTHHPAQTQLLLQQQSSPRASGEPPILDLKPTRSHIYHCVSVHSCTSRRGAAKQGVERTSRERVGGRRGCSLST